MKQLLLVDPQYDFIRDDGTLYDVRPRQELLLVSQDFHPVQGPNEADVLKPMMVHAPVALTDEQLTKLWPIHCVMGTGE